MVSSEQFLQGCLSAVSSALLRLGCWRYSLGIFWFLFDWSSKFWTGESSV